MDKRTNIIIDKDKTSKFSKKVNNGSHLFFINSFCDFKIYEEYCKIMNIYKIFIKIGTIFNFLLNMVMTILLRGMLGIKIILLLFVVIELVILFLCNFRLNFLIKKLFLKNGGNRQYNVEFNNENLVIKTKKGIIKINYDEFDRNFETPNSIFLFFSRKNIMLPLVKLNCSNELLNFLREKLPVIEQFEYEEYKIDVQEVKDDLFENNGKILFSSKCDLKLKDYDEMAHLYDGIYWQKIFSISFVLFFVFYIISFFSRKYSLFVFIIFELLIMWFYKNNTSSYIAEEFRKTKENIIEDIVYHLEFYDDYVIKIANDNDLVLKYEYKDFIEIKEGNSNFYLKLKKGKPIVVQKEYCSLELIDFLRNKIDKLKDGFCKGHQKNKVRIFTLVVFSLIFFCYLLVSHFVPSINMVFPVTNVEYYNDYVNNDYLLKVFPKEIPDNVDNVKFYYYSSFFKTRTDYYLYYIDQNIDKEEFDLKFREKAKWVGNILENEDTCLLSNLFSDLEIVEGKEEDFIIYLIEGRSDQTGSCYQGDYLVAAFNEETNEVIYRFSDWS